MTTDKKNVLSLLNKYQALLIENDRLRAEVETLKAQLAALDHPNDLAPRKVEKASPENITGIPNDALTDAVRTNPNRRVNQQSRSEAKIDLFMSLFRGRTDVYAKRWQNSNGKSGYSPACLNEWKSGICNKPRIKCYECSNKSFEILNDSVVEEHLSGKITAGLYPMCQDDTCYLLAIDFDDDGWQKDISVLRNVCSELNIPIAAERSRSGDGAHLWFFFEEPIPAASARKFGSALLTYSMNKRHEIGFKSYDRFFPNQDTMPKGGFENLIALPLQMEPRKKGNSVFIDEQLKPYPDQWDFLSSMRKLSEDEIGSLTKRLSIFGIGNDLGVLRRDDTETQRPWQRTPTISLKKDDFPEKPSVVKANMIYVLKEGISQRGLNALKRLAAFKNPEFYKAQAMRLPTYNKPRIISCSDETDKYLCLPRGCLAEVQALLSKLNVEPTISDETNPGRSIDIGFNGTLRDEQLPAVNELMKFDNGVLAAATAFGKTVVAAKLIAERKTSTLVIVHRKQLLSQWVKKLSEFLTIKEEVPQPEKRRGRPKQVSLIGEIGGDIDSPTRIVDVGIMQSLHRNYEISERVRDYGMVIVDECHHVPAFTFEQVLKNLHARYVYGLTATPVRLDGHHPIIFMHCGPIRYKADAKTQLEQSPFDHYVIPRFTSFIIPVDSNVSVSDRKEPGIQELYSELAASEMRNRLIANDVIANYEAGRSSLVLTERTSHVETLAGKIREKMADVIPLTGKYGVRQTREALRKISDVPQQNPLTIVATGKYIGEGFDEPRLDTLFLAMPISWRGTLQQYVGRLHRTHENKKEVQVYDYVDTHVRMFEKMYNKRLNGYASFGYKIKGGAAAPEAANFIFDTSSFYPVYCGDIDNAYGNIFIISPFVMRRRIMKFHEHFRRSIDKNIKVAIMTRPCEDFKEKDRPQLRETLDILRNDGVNLLFKSGVHQKFAVIDERIVWYGSINLLSFGTSEETMMRLERSNIASELLKSVGL